MTYRILLHPKAAKSLSKLEKSLRRRIKDALMTLDESPELKGQALSQSQFRRIRVGDYRAIYEIDGRDRAVIILYIGHRSTVYDDFARLF